MYKPLAIVAINGSIFSALLGSWLHDKVALPLTIIMWASLVTALINLPQTISDLWAKIDSSYAPSYKGWRLSRFQCLDLLFCCVAATLITPGGGAVNWHSGTWADTFINGVRFLCTFFASAATGMLWIGFFDARRIIQREGYATTKVPHAIL